MSANLQYIKTITSGAVSTLELTDLFSARYDNYSLICRDINITSGGNYPYVMFRYLKASDGSVDSTSNYDYANLPLGLVGTFGEWRNVNQTTFTHQYFDTVANRSGGFIINIYNPFDANSYTYTSSEGYSYYAGARYPTGFKGAGAHTVAQSNSGLKLETGITYATFELFGVV